jgi:hypothetical protein
MLNYYYLCPSRPTAHRVGATRLPPPAILRLVPMFGETSATNGYSWEHWSISIPCSSRRPELVIAWSLWRLSKADVFGNTHQQITSKCQQDHRWIRVLGYPFMRKEKVLLVPGCKTLKIYGAKFTYSLEALRRLIRPPHACYHCSVIFPGIVVIGRRQGRRAEPSMHGAGSSTSMNLWLILCCG